MGTTALVNDKAPGEPMKQPEFFNALLGIWLGNQPADSALKETLLGRAPASQAAHRASSRPASWSMRSTTASASTADTGSPWL